MNGNNTTFVGGESSSGNEMILVNNTVWKQFDVKKEGDYRIWIKGSGTFSVAIDDQEKIVNATMNRPATFSGSFQLKEGNSRLEITPLQELADNIRSSNASGNDINVIDSIWLVSDSNNNNRLHELLNNNNNNNNSGNISLDQIQVIATTPISNNVWSSQKYEINLNDNTTQPLMISLAEPFNPNLKAAIYTKEGELSKVENLIPLFYSLKSGIYIDSLAPDAKVVIYDASTKLQSFAVATFISLASYVLLILSANVNLTNRFKRLVNALNSLMKQRISQDRNNNNNRGYKS
jgi:hypothetical protein